jgi:hypothetical protein
MTTFKNNYDYLFQIPINNNLVRDWVNTIHREVHSSSSNSDCMIMGLCFMGILPNETAKQLSHSKTNPQPIDFLINYVKENHIPLNLSVSNEKPIASGYNYFYKCLKPYNLTIGLFGRPNGRPGHAFIVGRSDNYIEFFDPQQLRFYNSSELNDYVISQQFDKFYVYTTPYNEITINKILDANPLKRKHSELKSPLRKQDELYESKKIKKGGYKHKKTRKIKKFNI